MKLPTVEDWSQIKAFVDDELAAMDTTPRLRNWRYRALGNTTAAVLADLPRTTRLDLRMSIPEMRVLRRVAEARGLTVRAYLRRALGTVLVLSDDVDPAEIPTLSKGGPLRPLLDEA